MRQVMVTATQNFSIK